MKWFMKYINRQKWLIIIGIIFVLIAVGLGMVTPLLVGQIIDEVVIGENKEIFNGIIITIIVLTIIKVTLNYFREIIFDYTGANIIRDLRRDVFEHLQKLPTTYYDRINTGELMSRVKEDTESIQELVCFGYFLSIQQALNFLLGFFILLYINWQIALIVLSFMPAIAIIAVKYNKGMGTIYGEISDQRSKLNRVAQEGLSGVRLVKSLARESYESDKFNIESNEAFKLGKRMGTQIAKYEPLIEFASSLVILSIIIIGGFLVIEGVITVGILTASVNYSYNMIWPMRMLGWLANLVAMGTASIKKMEEIFKENAEENDSKSTVSVLENYDIKFENVGFNYNDTQILKDISLEIKQGETVAIMGMSGAGKTSLVNLLTKTYDATCGRILIGNNDIKEIPHHILRENVSLVMQDTFLFSASIKDNINLGVKVFNDEAVESSAELSKVDEFLGTLDNGIDTIIGERGLGLSGGQKQRVSIARGIIRDSKILILDDSTSALDTHIEYEIQKNLEKIKNATKIIIAHRISATKSANKIIIMDNGTIVEQGSHSELMKLKGKYYETYREQFKGLLEIKEEVTEGA